MKRLSLLTLVFTLCSIVFFLLLIFFRIPFPLYPLMSVQDALDLLHAVGFDSHLLDLIQGFIR